MFIQTEKTRRKIDREEERQITGLYQQGQSLAQVKDRTGRSRKVVRDILLRNGISLRPAGSPRKYRLDEAYFDQIDSGLKALWLGFVTTNAQITDRSITLQATDMQSHIPELFVRQVLGADCPVIRTETGTIVTINSTRLIQSLAGKGVMARDRHPCVGLPKAYHDPYWAGVYLGLYARRRLRDLDGKFVRFADTVHVISADVELMSEWASCTLEWLMAKSHEEQKTLSCS